MKSWPKVWRPAITGYSYCAWAVRSPRGSVSPSRCRPMPSSSGWRNIIQIRPGIWPASTRCYPANAEAAPACYLTRASNPSFDGFSNRIVRSNFSHMNERYMQLPGGRIRILGRNSGFPPVEDALDDPNGLLAIGGDLSPARLLAAYRHGIFPWFSTGQPILWWSPAPRMVLYPQELKISRSMHKRMKRQDYEGRYNTAF